MRKAGKDTKAIEEMIGRTSIKVDDIYTTIDSEQQADAVKAIPDALRLPMSLLPAGSEPTGEQIAEEEWRPHEYSVGHSRAWAAGRRSPTRLDNKESPAEARQMSLRRLGRRRHANTTGFRTLEAMTCVSGKLDLMSVKQTVPIFNLFIVCRINSFNP